MIRTRLISRRRLSRAIGALAAIAFGAALAVPGASAAQPWWRLTSGSTPAVMQEGAAIDEVQEIKVEASGGEVVVTEEKSAEKAAACLNGGGSSEECISLIKQACFPYDAEASAAQSGLEALYGAGNVKVEGGPGDQSGDKPYVVTFVGGLADREVASDGVARYGSFSGCESLEGSAKLTEKTAGRPDANIIVTAQNVGDADVSGETLPVTVVDQLPPGATAVGANGIAGDETLNRGEVRCAVEGGGTTVTCTFEGRMAPYEPLEVEVPVVLKGASDLEENEATVSGGNVSTAASVKRPIAVGLFTPFGIEDYEMDAEQLGGATDTQAGSHPFQLTTTTLLENNFNLSKPPGMAKDLDFQLPPGLLGNPTPFPQCSEAQFNKIFEGINECPDDTAVGVAAIEVKGKTAASHSTLPFPVFNLAPSHGEPARFGFLVLEAPVYLDTSVRTGGDYGVTVSADNVNQEATLLASRVSFWGVPGAASHNSSRGWSCIDDGALESEAERAGLGSCKPSLQESPPPLLSMPTSCTGPAQSTLDADSWQQEGVFKSYELASPMPGLDGCNRLSFSPEINVAPDLAEASSASGLTVGIHVPQGLVTNAEALAESTVKDTTVELPQGVTINPGGGDGLEACSEGQIGYLGHESAAEVASEAFSPTLASPFCPEASKVGTVKITTPLLPNPLTGAVYLASPAPNGEAGQNPFKTLLAMYIVAEDPVSGTLVKLPGRVELNQSTGQLISTFEDTPQLPFEDLTLHFFGGSRAPLATPGLCGSYTTKAIFTPWSGNPPVESTSTFAIASGPSGSPCPSDPRPFTPEFTAGTTNNQAGGYSELRTTMGRPDADQALGGISIVLPEGLTGSLSKVKLCGEPQAAEGTCGPENLVGHTVVTAGLGSSPVVVKRPGNVYITGPYNGHGACTVGEAGCAPFGLSIANPAEAGPFDLEKGTPCDCIVVRAKVEINPLTSQLTISSGALPSMLKGIPLDLQHIQVAVSRPEFIVNPTSCAHMKIEGSISGAEGGSAPISEPFQAANCASLAFKPGFEASASGHTSKRNGASLHVRLTYPKEGAGKDSNIRDVKVELPMQLPSRLETLQKACLAEVFDANPARCPAESMVGAAKAITPILPVPLAGPAYFVSYGGAKFPELVVVLQGDGVTIDLHGETFISEKTSVTSSTFKTVPDDPVESFELTLPEGKYSALGASANLCRAGKTVTVTKRVRRKVHGRMRWVKVKAKKTIPALSMPTTFIGQNGARVRQTTTVRVTGCGKAGQAKKASAAGRRRYRHR
jgi:hypothetical protein